MKFAIFFGTKNLFNPKIKIRVSKMHLNFFKNKFLGYMKNGVRYVFVPYKYINFLF